MKLPNKKKNQKLILRVQYFDSNNSPGAVVEKDIYLFDLRGDNSGAAGVPDGQVNQLDLDNYEGKIGLRMGDLGYSIFLDSDLDGVITEADAAAVGYFWNQST
jgi:hypothetical protein